MDKLFYSWDPDTGGYVGYGRAHESPEEPGVYLLPAYATWLVPPTEIKDSDVLLFVQGDWKVYPLSQLERTKKRSVGQRLTAAWKALW